MERDLEVLQKLSTEWTDSKLKGKCGLEELHQICNLFLREGVTAILDDDRYRKNFEQINLRKLVQILDKFKDDKAPADLPKIKKAEVQNTSKKLKESLNVKTS